METNDYLKDLKEIKEMMSKSSQTLSLSGLSGVLAGLYALAGAGYADHLLQAYEVEDYSESRGVIGFPLDALSLQLMGLATVIVLASIVTGIVLSAKKAKKMGETLWNASSRRLLINFSIPLVTGGLLVLILLFKGYYELIAPIMLLFYGMGCVNASKFTFRDVRYLGLTQIVLGLMAAYFKDSDLLFWALGFGVCHVLYGAMMYVKYDRN
ncbi:hypothetical protein SAMN05444377_106157 [Flavobacterium fontis]|uniref:Uncharacterized protein n=1 Tax=Flavobacterium fontis TaxID=1124188 RepID=A0A1M5ANN7_9FLAO|nr:hypothetical protein [Flavobacterium fontis]SHF31878.1 hypothetical protein SAMN05444377_106157 [Flavobacterium fontis]